GEAGELDGGNNNTFDTSQALTNLLETDRAVLSITGVLGNTNDGPSDTDVDWFDFDVSHAPGSVQEIAGLNDSPGTVAVVFDMDYADKINRADTTVAVFDSTGQLIFVGRESNIEDDQTGTDATDLGAASFGDKDPYIGPVHVIAGQRYYVAVMSNGVTPNALMQFYDSEAGGVADNRFVRLEPINSVQRIVEDHIGHSGYTTGIGGTPLVRTTTPTTDRIFDISDGLTLSDHIRPLSLTDIPLFIATDVDGGVNNGDSLVVANPFEGGDYLAPVVPTNWQTDNDDVQDLTVRSDGRMFGVRPIARDNANGPDNGFVGEFIEINPVDGTTISAQEDNIPGATPTPNTRNIQRAIINNLGRQAAADEFTNSDQIDAVTIERTGAATEAPSYDVYYAIRESDGSSKLYRARENGDATPANGLGGGPNGGAAPKYGLVGNINLAATTYGQLEFDVTTNASPAARTTIRVKSTLPGAAGNFTLNLNRPGGNTNADVDSVNLGTRTINLDIGAQNGGGPTAQQIVDAINNDPDARQLVTAVILSGNDNGQGDGSNTVVANNVSIAGSTTTTNGTGVGLRGYVTGLAWDDPVEPTTLYGVTSDGQFIQIDSNSGDATVLLDDATLPFSALTLGPQNVEAGRYQDMFFATTSDNRIVAINSDGTLAPVFEGDTTSVQFTDDFGLTSDDIVGLAFTPLDINLWHPTTRRANDIGHGINEAPDNSRDSSTYNVEVADAFSGTREFDEDEGGVSFYFGLEDWIPDNQFDADTEGYLTYFQRDASGNLVLDSGGNPIPYNTQFGLTPEIHRDLVSNPNLINTYGPAGGVSGSLQSNPFSLAGSVAEDRPALYVNYYLETENNDGQNENQQNDPFRDAARVFVGTPDEDDPSITNWQLVATNNSQLSTANPAGTPRAELPGFISHLSDAGLNSATPRGNAHQAVQELFDNTDSWRQLRVDLSQFAGIDDVRLRFDFSTSGRVLGGGITPGSDAGDYGGFEGSAGETSNASSFANLFEGFYIDDIIVGYAERGEMVTVPSGVTSDATTFELVNNNRFSNPDPNANPEVLSGPYQLEIRRTGEFATLLDTDLVVTEEFDTNVRHTTDLNLVGSEDFETGSFAITPSSITLGDDDLDFSDLTSFEASSERASEGSRSLAADVSTTDFSIWQTTPADLGATGTDPGILQFVVSVSSAVEVHGLRLFRNGEAIQLAPIHNDEGTVETDAAFFLSGEVPFKTLRVPFSDPNDTFTWLYDGSDPATPNGSHSAFIDDLRVLQGGTGLDADSNRPRQQGVFIVDSNIIRNSDTVGIRVTPGVALEEGVPEPGSLIQFAQLNADRTIPGIVITNNIIAGADAIEYFGEMSDDAFRPTPFGRIVNNTLVGLGDGIGVDIQGRTSPSLVNNIITRFGTGVQDSGIDSVLRSNFFRANASNGTVGDDAITVGAGVPLFVDEASGNYYLVEGSAALDSSIDLLDDRQNYVTFKNELGISISNIVAPERDVYGQLRVDSGATGGSGNAVFIDRGAVDRSDTDAPFGVLLEPIDNDNAGEDRDPNDTVVLVDDPLIEAFRILISDGRGPSAPVEGTGVDPATVSPASITLFRNGFELVEGVDYVLGFNASTGELRLSPLTTVWQPDSVYEIALDNTVIADRAGTLLRPNREDGSTRFTIILPTVEFDFGDAVRAGASTYDTLLADDGARHSIIDNAVTRLGSIVDGEVDAALPGMDDDRRQVTFTSTSASGTFSVDVSDNVTTISVTSVPVPGDLVLIGAGFAAPVIEFIAPGTAATPGRRGIELDLDDPTDPNDSFDTPETIAQKLFDAISDELNRDGDGFELIAIAADSSASPAVLPGFSMSNLDDEDGVNIAQFPTMDADGNPVQPFVFIATREVPVDSSDLSLGTMAETFVSGFLNPQDDRGANYVVNSQSGGFVTAWIDFNGDGVFDDTPNSVERILTSQLVVAGDNDFNVQTPANLTDKVTWARFRISPLATPITPGGLVVGGEVEDYQVSIINVTPTMPVDDNVTVEEDGTLDTTGVSSVLDNDTLDSNRFTPETVIVVDEPSYGTLTLDEETGEYVYEPFADFAGIDRFTYRVADQETGLAAPLTDVDGNPINIGTVTVNVTPVNDVPSTADVFIDATEDIPNQVILADELIALSQEDGNPEFVLVDPNDPTIRQTAPWDESAQDLTITALQTNVLGTVTNITSLTSFPTGQNFFDTPRGQIVPIWSGGVLDRILYTPKSQINQDIGIPLPGDSIAFDEFTFTVQDDGLLVNPQLDLTDTGMTLSDDTDNSSVPLADRDRLSAAARARIDVKPVNDVPVLLPDQISENNPAWNSFFTNLSQIAPIPLEDNSLVIPAAYLLSNDDPGDANASDELDGINDSGLGVTAVGIDASNQATTGVTQLGGTVEVQGSVIVYTPPAEAFGIDSFVYTATDSGITFDPLLQADQPDPMSATSLVQILVKPENDQPEASPLTLELDEFREFSDHVDRTSDKAIGDGILEFFADDNSAPIDLLRLGEPGSAFAVTPPLAFPLEFNESEQRLKIVNVGDGQPSGISVNALTLQYDIFGDGTNPPTGLASPVTLPTEHGVLTLQFGLEPDPNNPGGFINLTGHLISGTYEPNTDYNETFDGSPFDIFTYSVQDRGEITVPGADQFPGESTLSVNHGRLISEPATVTLITRAINDEPVIPEPLLVQLEEGDGAGSSLSYDLFDANPDGNAMFVADYDPSTPGRPAQILVGPSTASDEFVREDIDISLSDVTTSAPADMFAVAPTLDEFGVLTFTPSPDAHGYAVFTITVMDNGQSYDPSLAVPGLADDPLSVTRTLTIDIRPVNDAPVTVDRVLVATESEEFADVTGLPTGAETV
ncbi:MAG: GEVED domain-containing protein, partial [Planctomycetota bacterium]